MVKKHKKLWAHYEQLKTIVGTYIALLFSIALCSLGFSCLFHSSEIDAGIQGAVKSALLIGMRWYGIVMAIMTVLFIIWFSFYSDTVEFSDNSIKYYRCIFSKNTRNIPYGIITECVISGKLWNNKREKTRRRKIILFNKSNIITTFDIYYKLALMLVIFLGEKVGLVSDKGNLKSISKYYKIDFMSLKYEEQLKILKYYCKITCTKYKTGEEILNK